MKKKKLTPPPYIIPIVGQVTGEMLTSVMAGIDEAERGRELRVLICSPGGGAEPGIAIHDMLVDARREWRVVTEVWGEAASIAPVILQAGAWRRMSPNSRLMIHDPSGHADVPMQVSMKDLRLGMEGLASTRDTVARLLADRSGQPFTDIRKWMRSETVFTAAEALSLGFIDEVIEVPSVPVA